MCFEQYSFIAKCFSHCFLSGVDFQFRSVSVSISIIRHASLFFRAYSDYLPAMLVVRKSLMEVES